MTVPRLVATDLDGTLVRDDFTIGPRTVGMFRRLAEAGVPVVLVTGRPLRWLPVVYEQLGSTPMTVCLNGAAVYDPTINEILHHAPLLPDTLRAAAGRLRAAFPAVRLAVECEGGRRMCFESGFDLGPWEDSHGAVRAVEATGLFTEPAAKLLVKDPTADRATFPTRVGNCLAGLAEVTNSSSSGMAEVSAAGVTKASGLAWVAGRLGVPAADVLAFGDMPNDLPMLGWVGRGIAMVNAHPTVRAAAHAVTTASNDDEGVADYLEKIF